MDPAAIRAFLAQPRPKTGDAVGKFIVEVCACYLDAVMHIAVRNAFGVAPHDVVGMIQSWIASGRGTDPVLAAAYAHGFLTSGDRLFGEGDEKEGGTIVSESDVARGNTRVFGPFYEIVGKRLFPPHQLPATTQTAKLTRVRDKLRDAYTTAYRLFPLREFLTARTRFAPKRDSADARNFTLTSDPGLAKAVVEKLVRDGVIGVVGEKSVLVLLRPRAAWEASINYSTIDADDRSTAVGGRWNMHDPARNVVKQPIADHVVSILLCAYELARVLRGTFGVVPPAPVVADAGTEKLGSGSFGSVFVTAFDEETVCKVQPLANGRNELAVEYVLRASGFVSRDVMRVEDVFLRHSLTLVDADDAKIVRVYFVLYTTMERMDCALDEWLHAAIHSRWLLRPRDAARLAEQLVRGVHAIHAHGFSHTDLFDRNILVRWGGGGGGYSNASSPTLELKIADLGLAHVATVAWTDLDVVAAAWLVHNLVVFTDPAMRAPIENTDLDVARYVLDFSTVSDFVDSKKHNYINGLGSKASPVEFARHARAARVANAVFELMLDPGSTPSETMRSAMAWETIFLRVVAKIRERLGGVHPDETAEDAEVHGVLARLMREMKTGGWGMHAAVLAKHRYPNSQDPPPFVLVPDPDDPAFDFPHQLEAHRSQVMPIRSEFLQ